jgi:hypothetical protein
MSGQAISPEQDRSLQGRTPLWKISGWLLWGLAAAGALIVLAVRLIQSGTSGNLTFLLVLRDLVQPTLVLAYLVGYLIPAVRSWYIAATPPEKWNPNARASDTLEAWLTHLPSALFGLALVVSAVGILLSARAAAQGAFFALAELGVGVLLLLRSTALGGPMVATLRGRRWFFGGLALLLVPLYGTLVVQAVGQFNAALALSVLGVLAFAYSLGVSAFTFYGVRALMRADTTQVLNGLIPPAELEAFKSTAPPLTWWRRHQVVLFAWLPLLIALSIGSIVSLAYRALLNHSGASRSGPLSIWSGSPLGTLFFFILPLLFVMVRSYPGLRLHAQLLQAQEWGAVRVTPELRRALAHKIAPAFSVTVLLAGLTCGVLMNALDQAGLFSGIQAGLRSLAGPEQASDPGGDFLRWLAGALPDLLIYLGTLLGALVQVSIFFSRPFQRGQLAWREKMLAAEEARRRRVWATLVQRVEGAAPELGEPESGDTSLAPFPPALSDGMLALVYELSKERIARYKTVSLHPFGPLGWIRSIGATLLLALPGFLLNHLDLIGQFLGVK